MQYSNFTDKSLKYVKVENRVFNSLAQAEKFCRENELDFSLIEYGRNPELKAKVEEISRYQKAVLKQSIKDIECIISSYQNQINSLSDELNQIKIYDRGWKSAQFKQLSNIKIGLYESLSVIYKLKNELEALSDWK